MAKMKNLSLDPKGFKITGVVTIELWDGGVGQVQMEPFFLPPDKFTHGNIKRSINDNGYGTKKVLSARINIYRVYGLNYTQWDRSINLSEQQCQEACMSINQN
jgi:hypothetical protein